MRYKRFRDHIFQYVAQMRLNMDFYFVFVADTLIMCQPRTPQEIYDPFLALFTFLKVS